MEFSDEVIKYMQGELFSNALSFHVAKREQYIHDRVNYLANLVKDKKIIHLGCADHKEIIEYKMKNNIWLHGRLTETTNKCLGVEINSISVDLLKDKYQIDNVICANILTDTKKILNNENWDYLVLGEVLEHIDNPVSFLKEIRINAQDRLKKIVISVPNAFAWHYINNAYKNKEHINSDHRYYFTAYTLGKIITMAGYKVKDYVFAETLPIIPFFKHGRYMFHDLIHKRRIIKHPGLRSHIVMEAEL